MATDEEYLDNLLKSLTENKQQPAEGENNEQENADTNTSMALEDFPGLSDDMEPTGDLSEGFIDGMGISEGEFADFSSDGGISLEQLAGFTDSAGSSDGQLEDFMEETEGPGEGFADFSDFSDLSVKTDEAEDLTGEVKAFQGENGNLAEEPEIMQEEFAGITEEPEAGQGELADFTEELGTLQDEPAGITEGSLQGEFGDLAGDSEPLSGDFADTSGEADLSLEQLMDISDDSSFDQDFQADFLDLADSGTSEGGTEGSAGTDNEGWKMDIDDLLAETDVEQESDTGSFEEENAPSEEVVSNMENVDITDMIDSMENTDSDLDEINSLLKKADGGQSVDDDMLALLEGVEAPGESDSADDEFDIFADMPMDKGTNRGSDHGEERKAKNKKRKDKKKAGKNKEDAQGTERETGIQSVFGDEEDEFQGDFGEDTEESGWGIGEIGEEEEENEEKEKKPSLWSRFVDYITQEEEEEEESLVSDENAEILRELDEEDKKKGKKGGKKKKGKKGKKEEEGEDGKGAAKKGKKGKKPKKEKKPKPVKEKKEKKEKEPWENPFKLFSARHVVLLLAFCGTMVASICILSIFLPEHAEKRDARAAFHGGDYETVFELLYDKKLQGNDAIMFDRAKTVLLMERKLKSYENHMALGQELEAVDALIRGVECYGSLADVSDYTIRTQIDNTYQQICWILEGNYSISPALAAELSTYDSLTYTQRLYDLINGTGFGQGGDEEGGEDTAAPLDVLPEEEELLGDE